MKNVKTPDEFFSETAWRSELRQLRAILLATGLDEAIKWGRPCYVRDGANVVGIVNFKSYFGLWFFQGALLKDAAKVLMNAQEGRTSAMRQWRMTTIDDINAKLIRRYVVEAIALAGSGVRVAKPNLKPIVIPEALRRALAANPKSAAAFRLLTPGRRREYATYIRDAKMPATTARRIAQILPMISKGLGLNDKYRRGA